MCWRFENEDDQNLLDTMKSIKRNHQGVRFSDVLLSALSISFQNYFESKGNHIPNIMTAVIPARIEAEGRNIEFLKKNGNIKFHQRNEKHSSKKAYTVYFFFCSIKQGRS